MNTNKYLVVKGFGAFFIWLGIIFIAKLQNADIVTGLLTGSFLTLIILSIDLSGIDIRGGSALTDKDQSNCIRGVMAIVIAISHAHYYNNELGLFSVFKPFGYAGVSVFFFCSGYGVAINLKRQGYLNHFLEKRFIKVYCPYIIINLLYLLCMLVLHPIDKESLSVTSVILSFSGLVRVLPFSWYVIVILGWYIVFYLIHKYCEQETKCLYLLAGSCVIYYLFGFCSGIDGFYYNSSICLLIGYVAAVKEQYFLCLKKRKWLIFSGILFLASLVLLKTIGDKSPTSYSISVIISSVCFVIMIYAAGMKYNFTASG